MKLLIFLKYGDFYREVGFVPYLHVGQCWTLISYVPFRVNLVSKVLSVSTLPCPCIIAQDLLLVDKGYEKAKDGDIFTLMEKELGVLFRNGKAFLLIKALIRELIKAHSTSLFVKQ